ncbi:hypothetical protein SK128_006714, partial [Halocaridina rubra]
NASQQLATKVLLNEPSFQISSVYQLLGGQEALKPSYGASGVGGLPYPSTSSGDPKRSLSIQSHSSSSTFKNGSASKFSLRN